MDHNKLLAAIIVIILLNSCGLSTATSTPTSTETYTNTLTATFDLEKNRFFETAGEVHFSYVPPEGWEKGPGVIPDQGWKGPCDNNGCLLSFQDLGGAESAREASQEWTPRMFHGQDYEILSEEACKIQSGLDCFRVTVKWNFTYENISMILFSSSYYMIIHRHVIQADYSRDFDNYMEQDPLIEFTIYSIREIGQESGLTVTPTPMATFDLEKNRFFETHGSVHFSYVPPEGWTRFGGFSYSGWEGPCMNYGCFLNFQELGDAESAKDASQEWIPRMFEGLDYEVLSEGTCKIESGLECYHATLKWNTYRENHEYIVFSNQYYMIMDHCVILADYSRDFDNYTDQDPLIEFTIYSIREIQE